MKNNPIPLYFENVRVGDFPIELVSLALSGQVSFAPAFVERDGAIVLKEISLIVNKKSNGEKAL